jgi:hypothetical protein
LDVAQFSKTVPGDDPNIKSNHFFRRPYMQPSNFTYIQHTDRKSSNSNSRLTPKKRSFKGLDAVPIFAPDSGRKTDRSTPKKIRLNISNNSNSNTNSMTRVRQILGGVKQPMNKTVVDSRDRADHRSLPRADPKGSQQALDPTALEEYSIQHNSSSKDWNIIDENNPKGQRVYVQDRKHGLMEFFVNPLDTILSLKTQIANRLSIKVYKINLSVDKKSVSNLDKFRSLNLKRNAMLAMVVKETHLRPN